MGPCDGCDLKMSIAAELALTMYVLVVLYITVYHVFLCLTCYLMLLSCCSFDMTYCALTSYIVVVRG